MYLESFSKEISFPCKRVLLSLDLDIYLNKNNEIKEEIKIINSLPIIQYLLDHYTKIIIIPHNKSKEEKSKYLIYKRLKELLLEYDIYFTNKSSNELENTISNVEEEEILFIDNSFVENNKDLLKEYLKLVDFFINDISKEVFISGKDNTENKELKIYHIK